MGCCICKPGELNGFEKIILISQDLSDPQEFVEISLDSDSGEKEIEEWQKYKNGRGSFLNESMGAFSTLIQSDRHGSMISKPGSIIDSFSVNLHSSVPK
jgi:hypothetical protein